MANADRYELCSDCYKTAFILAEVLVYFPGGFYECKTNATAATATAATTGSRNISMVRLTQDAVIAIVDQSLRAIASDRNLMEAYDHMVSVVFCFVLFC